MQNKPNLNISNIQLTHEVKTTYADFYPLHPPKNKPNSNPNKANFTHPLPKTLTISPRPVMYKDSFKKTVSGLISVKMPTTEEFISEAIKPVAGTGDTRLMARGEPDCRAKRTPLVLRLGEYAPVLDTAGDVLV